jgi:class 3 adenylate cyclase
MAATKTAANAPERIPVVILFAETRGFTRMSEILQPAVVLEHTSKFFALVQTAINQHEGVVRNVLNDTLMASFSGNSHAQHAVEAAQQIQEDFISIEEAWASEYGIQAAVAIGLHAGEAVIGVAGEGPSAQPMIIGDSVTIAERLLHRARAGEFVLSKPVMDRLAAGAFVLDADTLPPLTIPRRDPIELFGVLRDARLDFT